MPRGRRGPPLKDRAVKYTREERRALFLAAVPARNEARRKARAEKRAASLKERFPLGMESA